MKLLHLKGPQRTERIVQLISEGRLIHWVTVNEGGRMTAKKVVTNGPVSGITTTNIRVLATDDETRNLSTWIDESYKQTILIAKAVVSTQRELITPGRLAAWQAVQPLIAAMKGVPIALPKWFEQVVDRNLPYGDHRVRRYWPAFVEGCKLICMIRGAGAGRKEAERRGGLTVEFNDFAVANQIFDRIIQQSLTLSATDRDMSIATAVDYLVRREGLVDGVSAANLIGFAGIRSIDQAYRWLRAAESAGTIYQANRPDKNNEKRFMRSEEGTFLGEPELIHKQIGLKTRGTYIHPINGKARHYGNE